MARFYGGFWALFFLTCTYGAPPLGKENKPCLATRDCPDSGSVCILPGGAKPSGSSNKYSAFNPSTVQDFAANGYQSYMDAPIPLKKNVLLSGSVGTDPLNYKVGDAVFMNGYACTVVRVFPKVLQPEHTDAATTTTTAASILNPGSFTLDDAIQGADELPEAYKIGQRVKQERFECKIVREKQDTPSPTKAPATKAPIGPKKNIGVCKCDASQRFPCDSTEECLTRMGNAYPGLQCIVSSGCPNPIAAGYCRDNKEVLGDAPTSDSSDDSTDDSTDDSSDNR